MLTIVVGVCNEYCCVATVVFNPCLYLLDVTGEKQVKTGSELPYTKRLLPFRRFLNKFKCPLSPSLPRGRRFPTPDIDSTC